MARSTPLNAAHRKAGGRMVDFAGWDMPVQYDGLIQEHERVRITDPRGWRLSGRASSDPAPQGSSTRGKPPGIAGVSLNTLPRSFVWSAREHDTRELPCPRCRARGRAWQAPRRPKVPPLHSSGWHSAHGCLRTQKEQVSSTELPFSSRLFHSVDDDRARVGGRYGQRRASPSNQQ